MEHKIFKGIGFFYIGVAVFGILSLSARLNPMIGFQGILLPILVIVGLLLFAIFDEWLSQFLKVENSALLFCLGSILTTMIMGVILQCLN